MPTTWWRRHSLALATVVLVLAWGSTFAAIKIGLRSSPPMLFAGLRSFLGGAVMCAVAASRGHGPRLGRHLRAYAVLALLNVVGFFGLQTLALAHLPSGLSAVLIYLQPVLTAVLAGPLLGERVGATGALGLALAFGGIVVVSLDAMEGHVSLLGIGYAVGSAAAWALGTIAFKREAHELDPLWSVAIPFVGGGIVLTAYGLAVEGAAITWSGGFVGALAWATLIGTALSWMLWFALVASGGAARTAANIFFVPIVALAVGALVLDEQLKPTLLAGAALVVLGVYLVNRRSTGPAER